MLKHLQKERKPLLGSRGAEAQRNGVQHDDKRAATPIKLTGGRLFIATHNV